MTGAPTPQSLEEQARHCPQCCEGNEASDPLTMIAVSYTHLTLPTILLV